MTVADLVEDNEYQFRVLAVNEVGEGPAGPESDLTKIKFPFGRF